MEESAARRNRYNCQHGYSTCVHAAPSAYATVPPTKRSAQTAQALNATRTLPFGDLRGSSVYEPAAIAPVKLRNEEVAVVTRPREAPVPLYTGPSCAENGSCYGDVSAATFKSKTVRVGGYVRSNGTYVRGYYRSK